MFIKAIIRRINEYFVENKIERMLSLIEQNKKLDLELIVLKEPVKSEFTTQNYSDFLNFDKDHENYVKRYRELERNINENKNLIWHYQYEIFAPIWYNCVAKTANKYSIQILTEFIYISDSADERLQEVKNLMAEGYKEKFEKRIYDMITDTHYQHKIIVKKIDKIIKHKEKEIYRKTEYILE